MATRTRVLAICNQGAGAENRIYILVFHGFRLVFGQSWDQELAQRPRLEKRYINQRTLAREIDSKAPRLKIVYIWGLKVPGRPPNPSKKVEGFALHLLGWVWRPIGPI